MRSGKASTKEPLLLTPLPEFPWQRIATNLFQLGNTIYLVAVDYFYRFPEVVTVSSTTSKNIILALISMFARHGIPEMVVSANGPQYSSAEFQQFSKEYSFLHITSSPHFSQSNGQAERGVKTTKKLLRNAEDSFLSLLSYRATALPWCKLSPAKLLMGWAICTNVPQLSERFIPCKLAVPGEV